MRALLYLKWLLFKNALKQLKEKPGRLIAVIVYAGLFAFLLIGSRRENAAEGFLQGMLIFRLIFFGLVTLMTIPAWISGTKKGSTLFSPADAQFLFTAPFRPQTLLMYGMLNQLKNMAISAFFLLYQIPNLKNMGLRSDQIVWAIGLFILAAFTNQCTSMYFYCLSYDSPARRKTIITAIYALPVGLIAYFAYCFIRTGHLLTALERWLSSVPVRFFPVSGWALQAVDGSLQSAPASLWIGLGLLLAAPLILLILVYRRPVDFYEDAMTVIDSTLDASMQKGDLKIAAAQKMYGKRKVRRQGIRHGYGESAIFFKQWRERRRTRPYFVGFSMIMLTAASVALSLMLSLQSEALTPRMIALIVWAASIGIIYFSSFNSTLFVEYSAPSFYLLPGSPLKKTAYASLLGLVLAVIDLLPGYLAASVILRLNPLYLLCGLLASAGVYIVLNAGQMFTFRIMGDVDSTVAVFLLMFITMIVLAPGGILMVFAGINLVAGKTMLSLIFVGAAFLINLLIGWIGLLSGKRHLN